MKIPSAILDKVRIGAVTVAVAFAVGCSAGESAGEAIADPAVTVAPAVTLATPATPATLATPAPKLPEPSVERVILEPTEFVPVVATPPVQPPRQVKPVAIAQPVSPPKNITGDFCPPCGRG